MKAATAIRPPALQRLRERVGALSQRTALALISVLLALGLAVDAFLGLSAGLAAPTYDVLVRTRLWAPPLDPRLLIVDIDEASLERMAPEFGRWPWSRDTLATVLSHIEAQRPAAIVWDVAVTDADRNSPGGDAALERAARTSPNSHFPVIRLPAAGDAASRITREQLPALWADGGARGVAVVPPVLQPLREGRLGFNNVTPDADGLIRRYREFEVAGDGVLKSMAMSVTEAVAPDAYARALARVKRGGPESGLIVWPASGERYPRVPFWQVFQQAEEGGAASSSFTGRIVVIGSTAPSLHDVHPTPQSPHAPGIETLARAIDNSVHGRFVHELPRWAKSAIALAVCLGLVLVAHRRSVAALEPWLLVLPGLLLALSYATLHTGWIFLDLQLAATWSLLLMAVLRLWNALRRGLWCALPRHAQADLQLWPWRRGAPWGDRSLDRLIDALQAHAPGARLVLHELHGRWPARANWPEFSQLVAVVGTRADLEAAGGALEEALRSLGAVPGERTALGAHATRDGMVHACLQAWARFEPAVEGPAHA